MQKVGIVDYSMGNLLSVKNAFDACGAEVGFIETPEDFEQYHHVVLPGVGAFKMGMQELEKRSFVKPLKKHSEEGKPLMGICLGMQMLLDESEEFGSTKGLGIISGKNTEIPNVDLSGNSLLKPFVGWSELKTSTDCELLNQIGGEPDMYFVHSFYAQLENEESLVAYTNYQDFKIPALIKEKNTYGCQFHPEKSGKIGLQVIKNFLEI